MASPPKGTIILSDELEGKTPFDKGAVPDSSGRPGNETFNALDTARRG